jgi:hypothetical protein
MWLKPFEIANDFNRQLKHTEIKPIRIFCCDFALLPFTSVNGFVKCNREKGFNPILIFFVIIINYPIHINYSG